MFMASGGRIKAKMGTITGVSRQWQVRLKDWRHGRIEGGIRHGERSFLIAADQIQTLEADIKVIIQKLVLLMPYSVTFKHRASIIKSIHRSIKK